MQTEAMAVVCSQFVAHILAGGQYVINIQASF